MHAKMEAAAAAQGLSVDEFKAKMQQQQQQQQQVRNYPNAAWTLASLPNHIS